ncbi:hypothetical protein QQS45_00625 [Alteriqipengyuania flavescens]|uniref:hypothetical protein n=1 Tax=Alteriqipengyuania flavescens TaxID=3053610 RepID=UPI0025B3AAFA|nr:hypothetical protein [Alteriqipengyuania flavescens]WJY18791.1 hypothetical protein QQW98_00625 [Alteriqipengyuania flavescens]WJY24731.1 hypothetical protein QQS45_00625 [Alteriqipengyuania flavescens]
MNLFDSIFDKVSDHPTVDNLAAKLGIDKEQAAKAIAGLAEGHQADGDTVQEAAAKTGLDAGILEQVREHIGGEGSLTKFASMFDKDGDGNPLNDILGSDGGMLGGLFGKK